MWTPRSVAILAHVMWQCFVASAIFRLALAFRPGLRKTSTLLPQPNFNRRRPFSFY